MNGEDVGTGCLIIIFLFVVFVVLPVIAYNAGRTSVKDEAVKVGVATRTITNFDEKGEVVSRVEFKWILPKKENEVEKK